MGIVYECYVCRKEIRPYMFNGIQLEPKAGNLNRYLCSSCIDNRKKYLESFIMRDEELLNEEAWLNLQRGIYDVKAGRIKKL